MNILMSVLSTHCIDIFIPHLLYVDKGTAPWTVEVMVQGGDHDRFLFVHSLLSNTTVISKVRQGEYASHIAKEVVIFQGPAV